MGNKIILIIFLFSFYSSFSQVGVGTTNPTKDLDINGELRIRNLPTNNQATNVLTTDVDGNISKSLSFVLWELDSQVATTPVDYSTSGGITVDNIDLGLSITVNIPANVEARIIINYSVPMGIANFTEPIGYYGVRFLKDGVEAPAGSRKFSVFKNATNQDQTANMVSVTNIYTENLASVNVPRTIVFSLNGYIEKLNTNTTNIFRFNMWSSTPPNFNWGKATLSKTVYIK